MPVFLPVDDPDDPRIALYRDVRDRDLLGREGAFMAEGEVVLRTALRDGRHPIESLLLLDRRLPKLADALEALASTVPVYLAPQPVLDQVAGFPLHRGVLALGRRAPDPGMEALLGTPGPARVLGLFGIANHDNMGGLFRNAAAFGARAVLLDPECCDPLYRKSVRVSVGAALTVPFARLAAGEDVLARLAAHGFEALALSPSGAEPLHRLRPPERVALLLGAEGPGLPPDVLARARTVAIPMSGRFDSLNVATAGALALHRLATAD